MYPPRPRFLINFYNLIFAGIVIILEGKQSWFEALQNRLFRSAAFLSSACGKGLFILYIGTMIFCVDLEKQDDFWKLVYILLGIF